MSALSPPKRTSVDLCAVDIGTSRRKTRKVTRACDSCKSKKSRCSGTLPCETCADRGLHCVYNAAYARGKPPTPLPGAAGDSIEGPITERNSPEIDAAEIEGQYVDTTSGLTFLHRAYKRLSKLSANTIDVHPHLLGGIDSTQHITTAGDRPLLVDISRANSVSIPLDAHKILQDYFEHCVVTYRIFHHPTVVDWLSIATDNLSHGLPITQSIGNAKASILFTVMAIAERRKDKMKNTLNSSWNDENSLRRWDEYFHQAGLYLESQAGLPQLESVQARVVQVLYLLQTSRMNKAWYVLGNASQIIAALGIHRKQTRNRKGNVKPSNYIVSQCKRRVFWVAYILDAYLSVVLGRPRYFHDDDINQDLPDAIDDEYMTPAGPLNLQDEDDPQTHVDSVIAHAKLSKIIGTVSSEVYSVKTVPQRNRLAAATKAVDALHAWQASLPNHLRAIRPSSLIPVVRRQAMALKLAYCHAIIHATRPFLLGNQGEASGLSESIRKCTSAAKTALQLVDSMSSDPNVAHAFWWSAYATFCALAVVYVWEIQQSLLGHESSPEKEALLALAERCHSRLAQPADADSPARRYTIILEELRREARFQNERNSPRSAQVDPMANESGGAGQQTDVIETRQGQPQLSSTGATFGPAPPDPDALQQIFMEWQTTDWLDLDASVRAPLIPSPSFMILWSCWLTGAGF
ncbi:putative C6 transcription factor [Phyllosticta capitalensis]